MKNVPAAPSYFGKEAKRVWDEALPKLIEDKIMTDLDFPTFELYCHQHDLLAEAKHGIEEYGAILKIINNGGNETRIKNPACTFYSETFDRILKMGKEFGLTPAARKRFKLEEQEEPETTKTQNIAALFKLRKN